VELCKKEVDSIKTSGVISCLVSSSSAVVTQGNRREVSLKIPSTQNTNARKTSREQASANHSRLSETPHERYNLRLIFCFAAMDIATSPNPEASLAPSLPRLPYGGTRQDGCILSPLQQTPLWSQLGSDSASMFSASRCPAHRPGQAPTCEPFWASSVASRLAYSRDGGLG